MDDGEQEKSCNISHFDFAFSPLCFCRMPVLIPAVEQRSPQLVPKSLSGPPPPRCSQASSPQQPRPPPRPRRWPQWPGRPTVLLPPSQQCKDHTELHGFENFKGLTCWFFFFFPQGGEGHRGEAKGGSAVCGARSRDSVNCQQIGAGQRCCHSQYWFHFFFYSCVPQTPHSPTQQFTLHQTGWNNWAVILHHLILISFNSGLVFFKKMLHEAMKSNGFIYLC